MKMATKPEKLLHSVDEFREIVNLGRGTIYKMIASGQLKSVYLGGRRLIPKSEAMRLIEDALADDNSLRNGK